MLLSWRLVLLILPCVTYSIATVTIDQEWNGGFTGEACISTTVALDGWTARLVFDGDVDTVTPYTAIVTKVNNREFLLDNEHYNAALTPSSPLCIGFLASCNCETAPSGTVSIIAEDPPASSPPAASSANGAVFDVPITLSWNGGFKGDPCIDILTNLNGWTAHLLFDGDVESIEVWDAYSTKVSNREFLLVNKDYNAQQNQGSQLCFVFVATCSCNLAPTTTIYIEGNSNGGTGGSDGSGGTGGSDGGDTGGSDGGNTGGSDGGDTGGSDGGGTGTGGTGGSGSSTGSKDYSLALQKSILFYYAQRSGDLPADNPIPWRGDSAINDCVPGGWYDAGDHVKFGLPMASSTTLLLWSVYRFKQGYQYANQLDEMYDMIKWPLDYFLAAWKPSVSELTVQVGDGDTDHAYWGRAEDMTMNRPCQTVTPSSPGSDVAAETAAALAVGSLVFNDKGDTNYGASLLTAAESLYSFAKTYRGIFTGSQLFYSSSGDADELCVAAVWLYKATQNNQYLTDAQSFATSNVAWALSWDDKIVACQILLHEELPEQSYKQGVIGFLDNYRKGNGGIIYTPSGLAWRSQWGPNRYAGNAAFAALLAAEAGIEPVTTNREWANEQINYLLGDNNVNGGCYSFMVGYGSSYPLRPHHRGASCPDAPATCNFEQLNTLNPNPQILQGALVGGPSSDDGYNDDRNDYQQSEVATDYNAGFQGALAGILKLEANNNLPATNNLYTC